MVHLSPPALTLRSRLCFLDNKSVPFLFHCVAVLLRESALKELLEKQQLGLDKKPDSVVNSISENAVLSSASPCEQSAKDIPQDVGKGTCGALCDQQVEPEHKTDHHHMDGHHLHLSSCHECLELENSTIQSVKYASVENIPDLPDDYTDTDVEEEADESFSDWGRFDNTNGKPPNVLVYTGGCEERYRQVHSLLAECIDTDRYAIYPLRPQQALEEPWLENTLLLVLVTEEELTPGLQLRFLTYLGQGGKVLGLSCSLCPAGLRLRTQEEQRGQIRSLNFTKSDSTEVQLSVLASGKVYIREPLDASSGEVELWGELNAKGEEEKDMVVVRVTHGKDGGEAVLCQVEKNTFSRKGWDWHLLNLQPVTFFLCFLSVVSLGAFGVRSRL